MYMCVCPRGVRKKDRVREKERDRKGGDNSVARFLSYHLEAHLVAIFCIKFSFEVERRSQEEDSVITSSTRRRETFFLNTLCARRSRVDLTSIQRMIQRFLSISPTPSMFVRGLFFVLSLD